MEVSDIEVRDAAAVLRNDSSPAFLDRATRQRKPPPVASNLFDLPIASGVAPVRCCFRWIHDVC